jgi:hypothetical protein
LFAKLAGLRQGSPLTFAIGESGVRLARMLFAVSLIPIGLSHIDRNSVVHGNAIHDNALVQGTRWEVRKHERRGFLPNRY